mmetsp:Transcript_19942/g.49715  ORF Transcript_19942/g.49715 Transcript_19942/m.49715 type:complete len:97 (-) Transcript_19942:898-1188(-)
MRVAGRKKADLASFKIMKLADAVLAGYRRLPTLLLSLIIFFYLALNECTDASEYSSSVAELCFVVRKHESGSRPTRKTSPLALTRTPHRATRPASW